MVRLPRLVAVLAATLTIVAAAGTASAWALGYGGGGGEPTGPASTSTQSQAGTSRSTFAGACHLYATSSSFGMSCLTGDAGAAKTVGDILGKGAKTQLCWDAPISAADAVTQYGHDPLPDGAQFSYYLHSCIAGLELDKSIYDQRAANLSQWVVDMPRDAHDCAVPYTDAMTGICIMQLTGSQRIIADALASNGGRLPGVTVSQHPSSKVRTREQVAYQDAAVPDGGTATQTAIYHVGGVEMWASMSCYRIYPDGPQPQDTEGPTPCVAATDGHYRICDGTEPVTDDDTPATTPGACWYAYPRSSADQPNQTYPFRAEADWTVHVRYADGHTDDAFASFAEYTDIRLPVDDVESIVIS